MEEAVRRLEMQEGIDGMGELNGRLETGEKETFAGMWSEGGDDYRVYAAFTEDGEETIETYIEGKPFEAEIRVVEAEASYAELESNLDEAIQASEETGLRFNTGLDVEKNRAEIQVRDPERYREALREQGEELPEHVVVVETQEFVTSEAGPPR